MVRGALELEDPLELPEPEDPLELPEPDVPLELPAPDDPLELSEPEDPLELEEPEDAPVLLDAADEETIAPRELETDEEDAMVWEAITTPTAMNRATEKATTQRRMARMRCLLLVARWARAERWSGPEPGRERRGWAARAAFDGWDSVMVTSV